MAESLKSRLARHISMSGPLPLADYMHWCMADRKQGYYKSANVFGAAGDFITAPEISQMFGELIGIWAIEAWKSLGAPETFNLVELGPGRGTLMKDLLRAAKVSKQFSDAAQVVLIETSPQLREQQIEQLRGNNPVTWCEKFDDVSNIPTIIIANEFLDVLPFRQYIKSDGKWHENAVGLDDRENLTWVLTSGLLEESGLPDGHEIEPDGSVFEISNPREAFVSNVADHISANTGAALFIDYGHANSGFGDTFQAVKGHQPTDPLHEPGSADLTSHVDFEALGKVIADTGVHGHEIMSQGAFLLALGLLERAGQLGAGKNKRIQAGIQAEAERLALPDQMGDIFKVFCFSTCRDLTPFANSA